MADEDNSATIVIDFNSIKGELNKDELLTDEESELLFDVDVTLPNDTPKMNVYLFDYESSYFDQKIKEHELGDRFLRISKVKDLNKALTEDPNSIICFYYNDAPKAVNQLSSQIKAKFKKTKTIIIAKGLSAKKAEEHYKSKYGASSYLKEPFELKQFLETINKLES